MHICKNYSKLLIKYINLKYITMKKLFILNFILLSFCKLYSQEIPATTNNGKKVLLNIDDKTWRYVNQNESDKPCQLSKTGNLSVINNTNHDIYFCYGMWDYFETKTIKVKSNSTYTIKDIIAKNTQDLYNYKWKVTYELPDGKVTLGSIASFQNGNFFIDICSTKEIEIND